MFNVSNYFKYKGLISIHYFYFLSQEWAMKQNSRLEQVPGASGWVERDKISHGAKHLNSWRR